MASFKNVEVVKGYGTQVVELVEVVEKVKYSISMLTTNTVEVLESAQIAGALRMLGYETTGEYIHLELLVDSILHELSQEEPNTYTVEVLEGYRERTQVKYNRFV